VTNGPILVVEDDAQIAQLVKLTLEEEGLVAVVASDGMRAVEFVERTRPALILLDMKLPVLNGEEVAERLQATPGGSPPLVLLSASTDLAALAVRLGAVAHVQKPFDLDELIRVVHLCVQSAAGD
jgi:CheY-like chemotaxis protein